jgi:hypothetical protein
VASELVFPTPSSGRLPTSSTSNSERDEDESCEDRLGVFDVAEGQADPLRRSMARPLTLRTSRRPPGSAWSRSGGEGSGWLVDRVYDDEAGSHDLGGGYHAARCICEQNTAVSVPVQLSRVGRRAS